MGAMLSKNNYRQYAEIASRRAELEERLLDSNAEPGSFTLEFLKVATDDFSTILGKGGFGEVYKGVLPSGKNIAVKRLFGRDPDGVMFVKELDILKGIKHQNVVQYVGYCAVASSVPMSDESGKRILADKQERFLCFEYISKGSLDTHISDESLGFEWNMRYKIIKGICNGLHFLHEECNIIHLDLKPENILMDSAMTPKIADFGTSRLLGKQQTRTVTAMNIGTHGYMAPEYLIHGIISKKADIFSLGVIIIEIITGSRLYPIFQQDSPESIVTSAQQFTEKVLGIWRNKFISIPNYQSMEKYTQQVRQCITIALKCVHPSMEKRPNVKDIIQMINALDQSWTSPSASPSTSSTTTTHTLAVDCVVQSWGDQRI